MLKPRPVRVSEERKPESEARSLLSVNKDNLDAHERALQVTKETKMTSKETGKSPIHALAIRAVQQGRELSAEISAKSYVLGDTLRQSPLSAVVSRLAAGEACAEDELSALEALDEELAARISIELISTKVEPLLVGETDDEQIWKTTEVSVYSDRGAHALHLQRSLRQYLETRQQLVDQAEAERLIGQLLR